jgi:segregation and condensation protein A
MSDHRIHLDAFDGPLDLLLHLIRKAEVEITDIPIAEIADQYAAHLTRTADIDIDAAGEFLLMAATLMEIKSRVLTRAAEPKPESKDDESSAASESDDPRADLVRQLLAYKQHRDAADALAARRTIWERRAPIARAAADREALLEAQRERSTLDLSDLTTATLGAAYAAALQRVDLDRLGDHHVSIEHDDTPIELHQADILHRVAEAETLDLRELFGGRRRAEIVGLFIALLELVRQSRVVVAAAPDAEDVILAPAPPQEEDASDEAHEKAPAAEGDGRGLVSSAERSRLEEP